MVCKNHSLPSRTPTPPPSAAGEKAYGERKIGFFIKNPIFLSPKTPFNNKTDLNSYKIAFK